MFYKFGLCLTIMLALAGCGAFVAGLTTGGLVVYDSRDVKTIKDDLAIRQDIAMKIKEDEDFKQSNITITSFHRTVLLTGQTPAASLRVKAEKIAKNVKAVIRVYNEITIGEPISVSTQSHDVWLTTKVKSKLIATPELRSGNIKVLTEDSSVYLIGEVTEAQSNLAIQAARRVDGVERVVKVFKYLKPTDEELS